MRLIGWSVVIFLISYVLTSVFLVLTPSPLNVSDELKNAERVAFEKKNEVDEKHLRSFFEVATSNGLGNQMFQYAAALGYAQKHGKKLFLNDKSKLFDIFEIKSAKISQNADLYSHLTKEQKKELKKVSLNADRFNEKMFNDPDYMVLSGYAHNPHFFENVNDNLRYEFRFKKSLNEKNVALAEEMKTQNSICIHVRRGDYLSNGYPLLSLRYYRNAVEHILKKDSETPHLYIFSNDTEWVEKYFKLPYPQTVMVGNNAVEDLHLMTQCRHNVIANSSFSWWGAWLNPNPDKIVVMPDRWDYWHDWWAQAIAPDGWVQIPAFDVFPYKIAVITVVPSDKRAIFDDFKKIFDDRFFIYRGKAYFVFRDTHFDYPKGVKVYTYDKLSQVLSYIASNNMLKQALSGYDYIVFADVKTRLPYDALTSFFLTSKEQSFVKEGKQISSPLFFVATKEAFNNLISFITADQIRRKNQGLLPREDEAYLNAFVKDKVFQKQEYFFLNKGNIIFNNKIK